MKSQTTKNEIDPMTTGLALAAMFLVGIFCFVAHYPLIIPLLLLLVGIHLSYFKKAKLKLFINLGFLLALIVFITYFLSQKPLFSPYFVPVACVAMLTMLLYNDMQLAFLMAFVASVIVALIVGYDFNAMLTYFVGGLTGIFFIRDARTRDDLIKTGFYVGIMQALCGVLLNSSYSLLLTKAFVVNFLGLLFVNGILAACFILLTSKVFEWLFGVLTNFSLLEMSDFNQPLLKRMVLEAPGTYHHSLIVSNLAEAAADAIGANALLTRVGAYYHDIGKMVKPEYFTENQMVSGNRHDNLEPSMSRLVIQNHVKEGVELAKKYKLNPIIIDFIPQHHGTGLMFYFYQRALESAAEGEVVNEEHFRYPGPKPQTREAAIVLLADSVEGAVRALEDQNPAKINEVVRKIVNNKFIDGQLDECDITLKNTEKICATFTRVLGAMYHSRIKYPEKIDDKGRNHKKPSETHSAQPAPPEANGQKNLPA